jgi:predicted RNA-binding protein
MGVILGRVGSWQPIITMKNNWLIIERKENWITDREEGFLRFGIPERHKSTASKIRKGDHFFVYISSNISAFSDIREVSEDGVTRLGRAGNYDTAFPLAFATKPVLTLDENKWVSIKSLKEELSFLANKRDWRQIMRTTIRHISDADAIIIHRAIKNAKAKNI